MNDIKTNNRLIDTHTHITPNVDDGASSLEMSLEMLRSEAEQAGICRGCSVAECGEAAAGGGRS